MGREGGPWRISTRSRHGWAGCSTIADRYPDDVALASPDLQACRTDRATWTFTSLDDERAPELAALLDRLLVRYRAEHA